MDWDHCFGAIYLWDGLGNGKREKEWDCEDEQRWRNGFGGRDKGGHVCLPNEACSITLDRGPTLSCGQKGKGREKGRLA